jgi:hypothetical protein
LISIGRCIFQDQKIAAFGSSYGGFPRPPVGAAEGCDLFGRRTSQNRDYNLHSIQKNQNKTLYFNDLIFWHETRYSPSHKLHPTKITIEGDTP